MFFGFDIGSVAIVYVLDNVDAIGWNTGTSSQLSDGDMDSGWGLFSLGGCDSRRVARWAVVLVGTGVDNPTESTAILGDINMSSGGEIVELIQSTRVPVRRSFRRNWF